jgi:hypothetical protein
VQISFNNHFVGQLIMMQPITATIKNKSKIWDPRGLKSSTQALELATRNAREHF